MEIKTEMYTKLFNELTDLQGELIKLTERIKMVQLEVESMYIED